MLRFLLDVGDLPKGDEVDDDGPEEGVESDGDDDDDDDDEKEEED